jgi:hypothetical protein
MNVIVDLAGWVGAVILLVTYGLLSFHRISSTRPAYQAANIAGSILLAINTAFHGAYPSTIVNVVWLAIGALALRAGKKAPEPTAG